MKKKKNMYIYLCIEIFFNKLLFTFLFPKILIFSVPSKLLLLSWNNVLKKNRLSIRLFWRWAGFLRKPDLCLLWLADQVASNSYQGMLVSAYLIDACGQLSGILISGKFNVWNKKCVMRQMMMDAHFELYQIVALLHRYISKSFVLVLLKDIEILIH